MNVSLDPGVETLWTLHFSEDNIIESDYPNFRVCHLRAYYRVEIQHKYKLFSTLRHIAVQLGWK